MSTSADHSTVAAKAERFRQLHTERILVLPNAWDVASALIAVQQGAQAVATTSAGVAWSRGSADGNKLSREQMLDGLISTVAAVDVPVSVDIEAGFGTNDDEVYATVRAVVDAGGVGVNIEDRTGEAFHSIPEQAARIAGIRAVADEAGVPLFINARTDIYLSGSGDFDETVDRARAYVEAGASGVFVPGPVDLDLIGAGGDDPGTAEHHGRAGFAHHRRTGGCRGPAGIGGFVDRAGRVRPHPPRDGRVADQWYVYGAGRPDAVSGAERADGLTAVRPQSPRAINWFRGSPRGRCRS